MQIPIRPAQSSYGALSSRPESRPPLFGGRPAVEESWQVLSRNSRPFSSVFFVVKSFRQNKKAPNPRGPNPYLKLNTKNLKVLPYTLNELPHPQVLFTFGLLN